MCFFVCARPRLQYPVIRIKNGSRIARNVKGINKGDFIRKLMQKDS
jgi:hypothetical protein